MSEKHLGKDIGVSTLENIDPSEHIVYADDVSYGESGIRGLIGSPYVLGAAMLAALGGFSFGYGSLHLPVFNSVLYGALTQRLRRPRSDIPYLGHASIRRTIP